MKWKTLEEAVDIIKSGDRVFVHGGAATPKQLVKAMSYRAPELRRVEVVHIHTEGEALYARPEFAQSFTPTRSLWARTCVRRWARAWQTTCPSS